MRQYRRDIRHRSDNRQNHRCFPMPVNRDNSTAADILYSLDNHAEGAQSLSKKQYNHSGLKAETEDGQTKPG